MENTKEMKIKFASLMGKLGVAVGAVADKETMAVYFEYLTDRTLFQVESAIDQIIMTGHRFPTLATLREISGAYRKERPAPIKDLVLLDEFPEDHPKTVEEAMAFIESLNDAINNNKRGAGEPEEIRKFVGGLTAVELADELI